jgi:hypothetical protein
MTRLKTLTPSLLCVCILVLVRGPLAAQDTRFPQVSVGQTSSVVQEADAPPPGLRKLFSNLGPKLHAYDDVNGLLVEGPANPTTHQYQWVANPFTPNANATVKEIEIALTYQGSGSDKAVVALYSDVGGLPGKALASWNVSNLPVVGHCCKLVKVTSNQGVRVRKGIQYWVVGRTNKASTAAYDGWEFVSNFKIGPIAFISADSGNVWTLYSDGTENAFAVFGTVP